MDLYIFKNGQTIGPLTPEQARTGLQSGQFNLSDKAITQSISDWITLEEVLKLLDIRADFGHAPASVSSTNVLPSPPFGTSVSPTSATSTSVSSTSATPISTVKPWGCLYALGLVVVAGTVGPFMRSLTTQIPALGIFNSFFMWLSLLSLVGLLVGLVSPVTLGRLARKFPAQNARYFKNGVTRKQATYIFGTASLLMATLGSGTDATGIQREQQEVLVKQQQAAQQQKAVQLAAIKAEQERKVAATQAKSDQIAQEREENLRQRRLAAEARSAEIQARVDERAEEARSRVAEKEAAAQAVAEAFNPKVKAGPFGVTVINNSPTDWTDCRIQINGGFFSHGYEHRIATIQAGEETQTPLEDFSNSRDERFDYLKLDLKTVDVYAKVNGNFKHYGGSLSQ